MSVYIAAFRHHRKKKDNTYQIKIKIRTDDGSFQSDFPIEYLHEGAKYKLSLSLQDWQNLSAKNQKIIDRAKFKYDECVKFLTLHSIPLSAKSINEQYEKNIYDFTKDIQADEIRRMLAYSLPPEDIAEYDDDTLLEIAENVEIDGGEEVSDEDMDSILLSAEGKLNRKKRIAETKKISNVLERCDAQYKIVGYPDFTKIIDVFGYYWCLRRLNGNRYITKYDTKIVLRIAEYIFTSNASNCIRDFDEKWIQSYFLHLRDHGYIDSRKIQDYTPLELYYFRDEIMDRSSQRKVYSESSFKDQIKKFKRYVNILKQETPHLDNTPPINLGKFNINALKLADSSYTESYTQKDHYVNGDELKRMFHYDGENKELRDTRDLFFIQVFTSGNRSIDKDIVHYKNESGTEYVEVEHSKTRSKNISGLFKPLRLIIERNGNRFPRIKMDTNAYNKNLRQLAKELNLNRKIEFVYNKMNSKKTEFRYDELHKCISQYFTRHTLVNYLVDAGIGDDEIIKITGHVAPEILAHYKRKVTVQDKQNIIDRADKKYDW